MSELNIALSAGGIYYWRDTFGLDVQVRNSTPNTVVGTVNLVPLEVTTAAVDQAPAKKEKDEMSRFYDDSIDCYVEASTMTDEHKQRIYLRERLEQIRHEKSNELMKKFGLMDDDAPVTMGEWLERINTGLFTFQKEEYKDHRYWRDYIRWRDPSLKEDRKGYEAALKILEKEYVRTCDLVAIKSPDDGLDAIIAFENWKPKK